MVWLVTNIVIDLGLELFIFCLLGFAYGLYIIVLFFLLLVFSMLLVSYCLCFFFFL